ncbi:hypothetical protein HA44_22080 [Mixta gaviniae]|nr:hypothetical protein HA44_22080 [Mixta gaviniae]
MRHARVIVAPLLLLLLPGKQRLPFVAELPPTLFALLLRMLAIRQSLLLLRQLQLQTCDLMVERDHLLIDGGLLLAPLIV